MIEEDMAVSLSGCSGVTYCVRPLPARSKSVGYHLAILCRKPTEPAGFFSRGLSLAGTNRLRRSLLGSAPLSSLARRGRLGALVAYCKRHAKTMFHMKHRVLPC